VSRRELEQSARLESYLARIEATLADVPRMDRREIVLETESHVAEQLRRAPARSIDAVLAELGPPEVYARRFLPETDASQRRPSALRGLARLTAGGIVTLPLLLLVLSAYTVAVLTLAAAVAKVLAPEHLGLWISDGAPGARRIVLGIADEPLPAAREVLGYWLIVPLLLISTTIHVAVSALLKRVLRHDRPRP
jgi:uncharacterized membrane protein